MHGDACSSSSFNIVAAAVVLVSSLIVPEDYPMALSSVYRSILLIVDGTLDADSSAIGALS